MHALGLYFGWPAGAVYSNLLASGICSLLVYLRMHAKLKASHRELASQAERQHTETRALAVAHQNELKHLADRHHAQALDRLETQQAELKAHVTATARPPAMRRERP